MCNIKLLYICLEFWVLQRCTNTRIGPTSSIGCKVVLCPLPPVFGCIRGGQVGSGVGPQGGRWSSPTKSPQLQLLSLPTVAQYLWTTQCDVNTPFPIHPFQLNSSKMQSIPILVTGPVYIGSLALLIPLFPS